MRILLTDPRVPEIIVTINIWIYSKLAQVHILSNATPVISISVYAGLIKDPTHVVASPVSPVVKRLPFK